MSKRVVVSVISDLVTDQRVHRTCQALCEAGYQVTLLGSKRTGSLPIDARDYPTRRIALLFQRKFFFYAEFNLRLFFSLLFTPADIFHGNDLDVMPAVWLAARLRGKPIVYDTHEYFLGMTGLDNKPFITRCWRRIESFIFSRVKHIYTVCESIAELYQRDYHQPVFWVRNLPYLKSRSADYSALLSPLLENIPENKHVLIMQGAGINPRRGVEELVLAMKYLDADQYHLLLVGGGDSFTEIRELIISQQLSNIITVIPKVPFGALKGLTSHAQLGVSLDRPDNINQRYGLPNKIFEYLHAGLPILVSRLVEQEKIVREYEVGLFIDHHDPAHIAQRIQLAFSNPDQMNTWKTNTERVRQELNWEKESKIVLGIFKQVEAETVK